MSKRSVMALALLFAAILSCAKVPMTAPAGTSIFLQANPTFVAANGGRSVVTALLTEPAGTLVPDGTVVLFFTDLGTIDPQGQTKDGVARVNFVSNALSGTAHVTAVSGGAPAPAPSASASPGATPAPSTGVTGNGTSSVTIDVGSSLPKTVVVTASPSAITRPQSSLITANVFDPNGNPVANVPVIFSVAVPPPPPPTGGTPGTPSPAPCALDSAGAPQFTNTNGQAFDTLRSLVTAGTFQKDVTVTAATPNGIDGTVVVLIN